MNYIYGAKMNKEVLKKTTEIMMSKPKGLLAMDESSPTCASLIVLNT